MADAAVELARELIRTDTINPPGSEERLAAPLAGRLRAAGLDVIAHELAPGRPSLVARLPGATAGRRCA